MTPDLSTELRPLPQPGAPIYPAPDPYRDRTLDVTAPAARLTVEDTDEVLWQARPASNQDHGDEAFRGAPAIRLSLEGTGEVLWEEGAPTLRDRGSDSAGFEC